MKELRKRRETALQKIRKFRKEEEQKIRFKQQVELLEEYADHLPWIEEGLNRSAVHKETEAPEGREEPGISDSLRQ